MGKVFSGIKKTLLGKRTGKRFKFWIDGDVVKKGSIWALKKKMAFVMQELKRR